MLSYEAYVDLSLCRESVGYKCEQLNLLDPVRDCADAHGRARQEDPGYPGITTKTAIH